METSKIGGLSEEQQEEVVKLILSGESTAAVGRAFSVNPGVTWTIMAQRGYVYDREERIWKERPAEELERYRDVVARALMQGKGIIALSKELGVHDMRMGSIVKDLGWKYEGTKWNYYGSVPLPAVEQDQPRQETAPEPVQEATPEPVVPPVTLPEGLDADPETQEVVRLLRRAAAIREGDLTRIRALTAEIETLNSELDKERRRRERAVQTMQEYIHDAEKWREHKKSLDARKVELSRQLMTAEASKLRSLLEQAA